MGVMYALSTYLAVMKRRRCSRIACADGFWLGLRLASHTMLEIRLPIWSKTSTMSVLNDVVSRVRERTLEMWVPRER